MEQSVSLERRHSGYHPGVEQWDAFIACWLNAEEKLPPRTGVGRERSMLLGPSRIARPVGTEPERDIAALEQRLKVALPASYKDFLRSFAKSPRTAFAESADELGMLSPSRVDTLLRVDSVHVELAEQMGIESSDAEYFRYGTRQDDAAMRASQARQALVVGRYAEDSFARIVLYTGIRTSDGEMEASLFLHSGEFRAPSFAELMRQLSFLQSRRASLVPPYSQKALVGSCADKLPLTAAWWS